MADKQNFRAVFISDFIKMLAGVWPEYRNTLLNLFETLDKNAERIANPYYALGTFNRILCPTNFRKSLEKIKKESMVSEYDISNFARCFMILSLGGTVSEPLRHVTIVGNNNIHDAIFITKETLVSYDTHQYKGFPLILSTKSISVCNDAPVPMLRELICEDQFIEKFNTMKENYLFTRAELARFIASILVLTLYGNLKNGYCLSDSILMIRRNKKQRVACLYKADDNKIVLSKILVLQEIKEYIK